MAIYPVSEREYEALRVVADGNAVRAADRGPWSIAGEGRLINHTLHQLRLKGLMDVPAQGGRPRLTDEGRESLRAYEADVADDPGEWELAQVLW